MTRSAHDRLIEGAITLTRSKGVAGTTVTDLLETSGVSRRSLYLNFPGGRDELLATATEVASARLTSGLTTVADAAPHLADAIRTIIGGFRAELVASDYRSGCPINAAGLGGDEVPAARAVAGATFEGWCTAVSERLVAEGVDPGRAASLAHLVIAGFEGALAMGVAARTTRFLDDVEELLVELVDDGRSGGQHTSVV